jgi:hypothetical protein
MLNLTDFHLYGTDAVIPLSNCTELLHKQYLLDIKYNNNTYLINWFIILLLMWVISAYATSKDDREKKMWLWIAVVMGITGLALNFYFYFFRVV